MSSRITQAKRSSLRNSWGSRKSRLAASKRCIKVAVLVHSTAWPRCTSSCPTAAEDVTFPHAWFPHGHDIDGLFQEGYRS